MTLNYYQTVEILSGICYKNDIMNYEKLKQIKSFIFGDLTLINTQEQKDFPLMIATPTITDIEQYKITRKFSIGILDLVKSDQSNLASVLSDTEQIALDLRGLIYYKFEDYNILNCSISALDPALMKFEDDLGGWFFELLLEIPYSDCYQNIPSEI